MNSESDLLRRANTVLVNAEFGKLNSSTMREYVSVSKRLDAQRRMLGNAWGGPTGGIDNAKTASVRRAAWTRRAHYEVAAALRDVSDPRVDNSVGLLRLAEWVSEAEAYPPVPASAPGPRVDRESLKTTRNTSKSKKHALHEHPSNWMDVLWSAAVTREFVHLDSLAVLLVSGCRPSEACLGVTVRREQGGLQVIVRGAKVRNTAGQPWRLLTVGMDVAGPADHLAHLADASRKGQILVRPAGSPNAISMGVSHLAAACLPGRRISAYDIRHQRASDARAAFGSDLEQLAAWLGHIGLTTIRYYGRLPRSGGSRGPMPIAATAARPVIRKDPSMRMDGDCARP